MTATRLDHMHYTPWPVILAIAATLIWGAAIAALASQGSFQQQAGGPPLRILMSIVLPVFGFLVAARLFPAVRAWIGTLDLALLAGLQTFRVLGIVFVFVYFLGHLPTVFAFAAGLGDVAVGLLAIPVTLAIARRTPGWEAKTRLLVIFGLLDFMIAFGTASLSGIGGPLILPGDPTAAAMQSPPMVMIPAWGVPLFIILLLMTWIRLRQTTKD
jgi:hypothetical protein